MLLVKENLKLYATGERAFYVPPLKPNWKTQIASFCFCCYEVGAKGDNRKMFISKWRSLRLEQVTELARTHVKRQGNLHKGSLEPGFSDLS